MTTPLSDIQPLVDYLSQHQKVPYLKNAIGDFLIVRPHSEYTPWSYYAGPLSYTAATSPNNKAVLAGNLQLSLSSSTTRATSTSIIITLSDPITLGTFDLNPKFPSGVPGPFFITDALTPDTTYSNAPVLTFSFDELDYVLGLTETTVVNEFTVIESVTRALKAKRAAR